VTQRSEQADRVLDLAKDEAEGFGHRYLGPEHLVLRVLRDGSGASRVLRSAGVDFGGGPAGAAPLG
jgi:ATP-dependent Clp protease ATP-binding subunit ClpA